MCEYEKIRKEPNECSDSRFIRNFPPQRAADSVVLRTMISKYLPSSSWIGIYQQRFLIYFQQEVHVWDSWQMKSRRRLCIFLNENVCIFFIQISLTLVPKVQWAISQYWFSYVLAPNRRQAITWTSGQQDAWRHLIRLNELTHWGRDKMAAISPTTLSIAFSWMKMLEFQLKFHWSLFLRVQLTMFQHWFR